MVQDNTGSSLPPLPLRPAVAIPPFFLGSMLILGSTEEGGRGVAGLTIEKEWKRRNSPYILGPDFSSHGCTSPIKALYQLENVSRYEKLSQSEPLIGGLTPIHDSTSLPKHP